MHRLQPLHIYTHPNRQKFGLMLKYISLSTRRTTSYDAHEKFPHSINIEYKYSHTHMYCISTIHTINR